MRQQRHNSKCVIFHERILKDLKCYNFLCVQRQHNCSPAASFANCVMTLYLLKVHFQTFLSTPITQKCQILSCDTLVTNERYIFYILVFLFNVINNIRRIVRTFLMKPKAWYRFRCDGWQGVCHVWDIHSFVSQGSGFLGCDVVSMGEWIRKCRKTVMLLFPRVMTSHSSGIC